jgi:DNA mismatch endonuclease, patch repair protein
MARIRGKNTRPERVVRSLVHSMGYRFRLHRSDLPGTPDIVFVGLKKIIFVHGCFWHRHRGCTHTTMPKTNATFWAEKFSQNVERDRRRLRALKKAGWKSLIVWSCETKDVARDLSPANSSRIG